MNNLNPLYVLNEWQTVASKQFGKAAAKSISKARQHLSNSKAKPITHFLKSMNEKELAKEHSKDAIRHVFKGKKDAFLKKPKNFVGTLKNKDVADSSIDTVQKATHILHNREDALNNIVKSGIL